MDKVKVDSIVERASKDLISGLEKKIRKDELNIYNVSPKSNKVVFDDPTVIKQKKIGFYTFLDIVPNQVEEQKSTGHVEAIKDAPKGEYMIAVSTDYPISDLDDSGKADRLILEMAMVYIASRVTANLELYLAGNTKYV